LFRSFKRANEQRAEIRSEQVRYNSTGKKDSLQICLFVWIREVGAIILQSSSVERNELPWLAKHGHKKQTVDTLFTNITAYQIFEGRSPDKANLIVKCKEFVYSADKKSTPRLAYTVHAEIDVCKTFGTLVATAAVPRVGC